MVVVGASIAGLCVARGLAEHGADVAVVDPAPGSGASGRSAGMVASGLAEHPARLAHALGDERTAALLALGRRSADHLAEVAGAARVPQVWVASTDAEREWIDRSLAVLQRLGLDAASLDAASLATYGIHGTSGFSTPGDALVDPVAALAALAARAEAAGARFVEGRIRHVTSGPTSLIAAVDDRPLAAEMAVWAAADDAAEPALSELCWPVREHAAVFSRSPTDPPTPCVGRAGHGWTGFRPVPDGVLVTGCRWATPHLEINEREPITVAPVQRQLAAFADRFLGASAPAPARWAWIATHSCDGLPLVGPLPGDVRTLVCVGFGGHDWGLAPAAAALLVDGMVGGAKAPEPWLAPARMV